MKAIIGMLGIVVTLGIITGSLQYRLDRWLRRNGMRLPAPAFVILFSLSVALLVTWLWTGFDDDRFAGIATLVLSAVIAYLTLPAVGLRRVEEFERGLRKKGIYKLDADAARKRIRLMLPFLVNPLTLFHILWLAGKRGEVALSLVRPPKVRRQVQEKEEWEDLYEEECERDFLNHYTTDLREKYW